MPLHGSSDGTTLPEEPETAQVRPLRCPEPAEGAYLRTESETPSPKSAENVEDEQKARGPLEKGPLGEPLALLDHAGFT